ncbi:MAG: phage/plasmid primase, P4 family [Methanospirillum sp.]
MNNKYCIFDHINITDEIYHHLATTYGILPGSGDIKRKQWLEKHQEDGDPSDPYWQNPFLHFAQSKEGKDGKRSWVVNYKDITDYCVKKYAILNLGDRCFVYDNGIYRQDNGDIEETIKRGLEGCGYAHDHPIGQIVSEIKRRVRVVNRCLQDPFNQRIDLIPCNNGVYNLRTKELEPFSPLHGFTYKFPPPYNPDSDTGPMMDYISGLVKEEGARFILQMLSSIVIRDHNKRLYLIYNLHGNNGKSTFLNLVKDTVGEKNVSNLSPQEITNGVFNCAELDGKVVNIASDIEEKAIYNTAIIKQLTGYDSIYAQRKFGHPFSFIFRGVCIWGCNTPPRIMDNSDAFNRRLVLIEFPYEFKQDSRFAEDLVSDPKNREALLKIAIENVPNLLNNGVIETDIRETRHRLKMNSDSVYAFVSEMMEPDDRYTIVDPDPSESTEIFDSTINFRNVHRQYKDYCNEKNLKKSLGLNKFKDALSDHSIHVIYKGSAGNQTALVIGARLKTRTVDFTNASLSKFVECPA